MCNIMIKNIEDLSQNILGMTLDVDYVLDVKAAYDYFNRQAPDIALIDLTLEKQDDGADLAISLCKSHHNCIFFLHSSRGHSKAVEKAIKNGICEFFDKHLCGEAEILSSLKKYISNGEITHSKQQSVNQLTSENKSFLASFTSFLKKLFN